MGWSMGLLAGRDVGESEYKGAVLNVYIVITQ